MIKCVRDALLTITDYFSEAHKGNVKNHKVLNKELQEAYEESIDFLYRMEWSIKKIKNIDPWDYHDDDDIYQPYELCFREVNHIIDDFENNVEEGCDLNENN